jgi:hypothetical protein
MGVTVLLGDHSNKSGDLHGTATKRWNISFAMRLVAKGREQKERGEDVEDDAPLEFSIILDKARERMKRVTNYTLMFDDGVCTYKEGAIKRSKGKREKSGIDVGRYGRESAAKVLRALMEGKSQTKAADAGDTDQPRVSELIKVWVEGGIIEKHKPKEGRFGAKSSYSLLPKARDHFNEYDSELFDYYFGDIEDDG